MTACPLDCYDACQVVFDEGVLKGGSEAVTAKHLCPHLNHYDPFSQIQDASFEGKTVELGTALDILAKRLKETDPSKVLFYKGSGNLGKMQSVSQLFFGAYGATMTRGSLCDAAGHNGIIDGRGYNEVIEPSQIAKSEVIVLWGRNPSHTHSHLLPYIQGKKLIVIDPIRTDLAKKADIHIQIKPRGDFYLAILLARFAMMEEIEDHAYIEEFTDNYKWFHDFVHSIRIKVAMEKCDILPSDIYAILNLLKGHKVTFIVGASVQKYTIGSSVIRAIDSLAVLLGLIGKEGCGISFLGDSSRGVANPFKVKSKTEVMASADFSQYDLIIFQGSNAMESMPNSLKVANALEGRFVVYFGLDVNATSQRADLIIPAKNFLAKEDIRFSYSDHTAKVMHKKIESTVGISEYDLTKFLCDAFDKDVLATQEAYIAEFISSCDHQQENIYRVKNRDEIAYAKGFETDEEAFVFIEEFHDRYVPEDLFLISPKFDKALNTMFKRPEHVYLHSNFGYDEGTRVCIASEYGSVTLPVKIDDRQRQDTVCIYVGTKGLNNLTSSLLDETGSNPVYQEISVKVS